MPRRKKTLSVSHYRAFLILVKHVFTKGTTKRLCPNTAIMSEIPYLINSKYDCRTKEVFSNLGYKGFLVQI